MYSQNEEERVIREYFGQSKHTFVSIGENDGTTFSNIRALAESGWIGICIEPAPIAFEKLEKVYENNPHVGCYNMAIANHNGKVILEDSGSLIHKGDTSLVSTIVPEEKQRFDKVVSYNSIEVPCKTWAKFMYDHVRDTRFQVISIDAEGMDYDILLQMDAYGTLNYAHLVCIEWNGDNNLKSRYDDIMLNHTIRPFQLIHLNGENIIYAR